MEEVFQRAAFIAGLDDLPYEEDTPEEQEELQDEYDDYDDEIDDELLATELNLLADIEETANIAEETITADHVAEVIQTEQTAYAAWDTIGARRAKGKGKGKGSGKSKEGKGKKGRRKGYGVRLGGATLEERKARLAKLKSQTRCNICGERGHLSQDPQCPKRRSKPKPINPTAELAIEETTTHDIYDAYPSTFSAQEEYSCNQAFCLSSVDESPEALVAMETNPQEYQFVGYTRPAVRCRASASTTGSAPRTGVATQGDPTDVPVLATQDGAATSIGLATQADEFAEHQWKA